MRIAVAYVGDAMLGVPNSVGQTYCLCSFREADAFDSRRVDGDFREQLSPLLRQ
jgi:hypothetical protein